MVSSFPHKLCHHSQRRFCQKVTFESTDSAPKKVTFLPL
nr:hypothetical protein KJK04_p0210 [Klebsiella quasipneumoniae]UWX38351.1 hypothetical protein KK467_p0215 [Klebsiella pneumoniae]